MVTEKIDAKWETLSKQQKKLGAYFKENFERAAYMTAARVAAEAGVSEATVVRFAAALEFEGYHDFLKALKGEAKSKINPIKRMEIVSEKLNPDNILKDVLKSDMAQIEKTINEIDTAQFHGAVECLTGARAIYIVGLRSSASLAQFMGFYFNMIFEDVKIIIGNSAETISEKMIRIGEKDAVVGISFPRYSASVVKALEFAKERGANIISITDGKSSPIVKFASYSLFASSEMDSFADSLVAPMSVINALIHAICCKKKTELGNIFRELEKVIEQQEVYD